MTPPPDPGRPGGRPVRPPTPSSRRAITALIVGVIALAVAIMFLVSSGGTDTGDEIGYTEFLEKVETGQVTEIVVDDGSGAITGRYADSDPVDPTTFRTKGPRQGIADADQALLEANDVTIIYRDQEAGMLGPLIAWMLPLLLIVALVIWFARRQGQMASLTSIGRSKAKVYTTERPSTVFDDVAGYESVKEEIREVVDFLKYPNRFTELGARIPKGVLLVGPPGTGKTLLARAVAGEAGVPFISVTGSDFMEMFVGVGAARVRDLFETARKQAPAIVFVDEIDSIGRKRGTGLGGGHDEREQTLNQMLAEMDGFETSEGVVMMAATNRPDVLDPALLRPGRFDRQIVVPLPSLSERREILDVHTRGKRIGPDVDLDRLARGTPGMSGADLANLVNEAALHAVRRGADDVHPVDVEGARDRVLMGLRRTSMVLSPEEKEIIAHHEAGHALVAYLLPMADPVHKVTILPTGMALGVTQQLPEGERHLYQRPFLEDTMGVLLGGRLAEELVFGIVSTGAQSDLVRATEIARSMVREWGMSSRIGPMAWGSQAMTFIGDDLMHSRDYSEDTARVIDEEVERILREQQERIRELLRTHRAGLSSLAGALLEHETVDGAEVGRLIDTARSAASTPPLLVKLPVP
jgi:cell division protease FtsH